MKEKQPSYVQAVAKWTIAIILTIGAVILAWQLREVFILLFLSLALSSMMRGPIEKLIKNRIPPGLAMPLTFLLIAAVLGSIAYFALPNVAKDWHNFSIALATQYDKIRLSMLMGGATTRAIVQRLPSPAELGLVASAAPLNTAQAAQSALSALGLGVLVLSQGLLIFFLSLYWSADRLRFERLALAFVSPENRASARAGWREFENGLGRYLLSEGVQSLLIGGILTFGFLLIGMPYPFLMAFWAAAAWALPLLGGPIALAPIIIVGFMTSPLVGALASVITIATLAFMEFVVERKLYPRERYGGSLTLIVTLALVSTIGVLGFIAAPPLTAAIQMFINSWLYPKPAAKTQITGGAWRAHLDEVRDMFAQLDEPSPRTRNLLGRLETLAREAE